MGLGDDDDPANTVRRELVECFVDYGGAGNLGGGSEGISQEVDVVDDIRVTVFQFEQNMFTERVQVRPVLP